MRLPQASLTMRQMTPVSSGEIQAVRSPRMRFTLRRMMASVMIVGLVLSIPFGEIFRSTDYAGFAKALAGHANRAASLRDTETAKAILLIGGNPTEEHPLLAWNLRTNVRLNNARLYIANREPIKLRRQAKKFLEISEFGYAPLANYLAGNDGAANSVGVSSQALGEFRDALNAETELVVDRKSVV